VLRQPGEPHRSWRGVAGTQDPRFEVRARAGVGAPAGTTGEVWVPLASATGSISWPLNPGATFLRRVGNYDVYRVSGATVEFGSAPVTFAALEQLVTAFSTDSRVTKGLIDKLEAAEAANNPTARGNLLDAFNAQVSAQTGKAFTLEQAQVLRTLPDALR
jgi:hypothetical protein